MISQSNNTIPSWCILKTHLLAPTHPPPHTQQLRNHSTKGGERHKEGPAELHQGQQRSLKHVTIREGRCSVSLRAFGPLRMGGTGVVGPQSMPRVTSSVYRCPRCGIPYCIVGRIAHVVSHRPCWRGLSCRAGDGAEYSRCATWHSFCTENS